MPEPDSTGGAQGQTDSGEVRSSEMNPAEQAARHGAHEAVRERGEERFKHHGHEGHGRPEEYEHEGHGRHDRHKGHTPEMFRNRFFVSLALTLPVLYYSELIQDLFEYTAVAFPGSYLVEPVFSTVIFVYGGGVFLQGAWRELGARQPGMMTLIALAISVAFFYSLSVTLGFPGEPFYWEFSTLIVIMLLGHWIEMRSVESASRALEHLASLLPPAAHRIVDGRVEDVPVDAIQDGDLVLVRPGEQVPVDGVIEEGASAMNEAFLTGESRPVPKETGDEVVGGSVNGEGALRVRVTRTGESTTLSQIMRLVAEAQASRSRFQHLADQAALVLVGVAVVAGGLTLGGWALLGAGATFAVARAVTVLVIACPHALGLAIPLVTVNATALSARNGILVRNRASFERAGDIQTVALDKTGTLTEGKFGVRAIYAQDLPEDKALSLTASLEAMSEHPLAHAIVEEGGRRQLGTEPVSEFRAVSGKGVEGRLGGILYRVGRPEWAPELGLSLPPRLEEGLRESESRGESVIALMDSDRVIALFGLADRIRASARTAIQGLRDLGVRTVMITGDAEAVARTVSKEIGIDEWHARVLPQDKSKIVEAIKNTGRTAFVGDGINDAPALLTSDLGIAIGAGTNVAIESADVVLVENDPEDVVRAIRLAKATRGKMMQNLFWATGYNVVAIPLAAGVAAGTGIVLSPAVGAVFMSASTVIVSVNAMLLRRVHLG